VLPWLLSWAVVHDIVIAVLLDLKDDKVSGFTSQCNGSALRGLDLNFFATLRACVVPFLGRRMEVQAKVCGSKNLTNTPNQVSIGSELALELTL
jgi:hypothetical protein